MERNIIFDIGKDLIINNEKSEKFEFHFTKKKKKKEKQLLLLEFMNNLKKKKEYVFLSNYKTKSSFNF